MIPIVGVKEFLLHHVDALDLSSCRCFPAKKRYSCSLGVVAVRRPSHCLGGLGVGRILLTRSRGGPSPRDAAVTRTSKQAGKALRSQGHQLRSCHETKRFRILATLKQGNKSMYSNTSGYVDMGLRLDCSKGITEQ